MSEKHDIIKILEFAESKRQGFTLEDIIDYSGAEQFYTKELGNSFWVNFVLRREYPNRTYDGLFSLYNIQEILGKYESTVINIVDGEIEDFHKSAKFTLSTEGYFKLIQYRQLEEATSSSGKAQRTANWALFLAIIVGIAQIVMGL
jgi:hypothetical protein